MKSPWPPLGVVKRWRKPLTSGERYNALLAGMTVPGAKGGGMRPSSFQPEISIATLLVLVSERNSCVCVPLEGLGSKAAKFRKTSFVIEAGIVLFCDT